MSEAKLVFTTDIKQVERDNAKLTKDNARLVESLRKVKQEGIAVGDAWTKQQAKTKTANDAWLAGLKRIEAQALATKRALEGAMLAEKGRSFQGRQDSNLAMAVEMARKLPVVRAEAAKVRTEIISLGRAGNSEFGSMIGSLISTVAVVGTVTAAYRQWRSEIESMGGAHRTFSQKLTAELATAGDLTQGPKVSAAINAPGAGTPEQRTAAFAGIREAAPLIPLDKRLALMQEVSKQAPTGVDLKGLGGLAGTLADIKPGAGAGDIMDMAVAIQAKAGAGAEKFGGDKFLRAVKSQVAAGKTPEEAFGFALAAIDANVSADAITQAAVGGKPSREQAFQLARVKPEAVKARTQELIEAQRTDAATARLATLGTFTEGRTALGEQRTAEALVPGKTGETAASIQQTKEQLRAISSKRGFFSRAAQGVSEFGQTLQDIGIIGGRGAMEARRRGISTEEQLVGRAENFGAISGDEAAKMRAAIEENTRAVNASNRQRAAVNVDKHTE